MKDSKRSSKASSLALSAFAAAGIKQLVPWWTADRRKLATFLRVFCYRNLPFAQPRPLTRARIVKSISRMQSSAVRSSSLRCKTRALWRMEVLGFLLAWTDGDGAAGLMSAPREARPVAHVGMGAGVAEKAALDPALVVAGIEALSDPRYRNFSYEPLGAMLAACDCRWSVGSRVACRLLNVHSCFPDTFLESFSERERKLISHGYGRILFFKCRTVRRAIEIVLDKDFLHQASAIRGIAFAYAMVNHSDIDRVLQTSESIPEKALREVFQAGLLYALLFWEWHAPGTLADLASRTAVPARWSHPARMEAERNLERGYIQAFSMDGHLPGAAAPSFCSSLP